MGNTIIRVILGSALLVGLFTAGWRVYSRLPNEDRIANAGERAESELTILLRLNAPPEHPTFELALYPLDFQALEREFSADPHSGRQFDDFLAQRLRGQSPLRAQLDRDGRAMVKVSQGNWWIHAKLVLPDEESAEWRLPVTVVESKQTVELTPENAYERTKKF